MFNQVTKIKSLMLSRMKSILEVRTYGPSADAGLLLLRMGAGLLMMTHGWPKLSNFSAKAPDFYNFIGMGGEWSLALTVLAEFFCSLFLVLGIGTRMVLVPLIIVAAVIVFVVHGPDPLGDKESGLLFLVPYITLILTGPGKYAVDYLLWPGTKK
jgi:putative oxidoreductase